MRARGVVLTTVAAAAMILAPHAGRSAQENRPVPQGAQAGEAAPQAVDPEAAQRQLELLRQQIAALEARLAGLEDRRSSVVAQWEAADVRLVISRRELERLQLRLEVLTRDEKRLQDEVSRLAVELENGLDELSRRIVALYRMGSLSYLSILLAADTADEILASYQLISRLAAQDRTLVTTVRTQLAEHQAAVAELGATRRRLVPLREEEARAVARLEQRQLERQELIRKIDIEAAAQRQALTQREQSALDLEGLLFELAAAGPATTTDTEAPPPDPESVPAGPEDAAPVGFASWRGSLPWPGDGEVTLNFGRQRHPVYQTYTVSKGIEIGAPVGNPVQAVFPGRVVFADWFENYGLMVILSHGNDFFTIYGHLAAVRVRQRAIVEAGTEIGAVGDTGSLTGPSLYFEIRQGQDALNPTLWLRRR